jgi:lipopolysaccharide transport system ATP-binding protein
MPPIISVENLSKSYLVGHRTDRRHNYVALRDVVGRELRNFGRKAVDVIRGRQVIQGDEVEDFWALKDVSFEVQDGEVLGIIGRNGAGKSTLLKILSRITSPTVGRVTLRGRVASLLEVGTGFHPELSGRENIFLNGAVLGMSRPEIRAKFDEIVAFAEVERFLDTPVKHYSSGMYVRLAFAVAAHLEPEILIVDEVLAVGDAEFQKKCLGRMDEVSRRDGRTVLFVSHNMAAVQNLCTQSLLLEDGRVSVHGSTAEVIGRYLRPISANRHAPDLSKGRASWAKECITAVRLLSGIGLGSNDFGLGENITVELDFTENEPLTRPVMGIVVRHRMRGEVAGINTRMTGYWLPASRYLSGTYSCNLLTPPLLQGEYVLDVWLGDGNVDIDMISGAAEFTIHERDVYGSGVVPFKDIGTIFLNVSWNFHESVATNLAF